MTDASGWFVLIGVLGGAALTGTVSLTMATLNHRWADSDQQRSASEEAERSSAERLRATFRDYLVATNAYYHAVHHMHELGKRRGKGFDTWLERHYQDLQEKYQYLTINAARTVRELAREYNQVLYGLRDAATAFDERSWSRLNPETNTARERLRTAMRADLGIDD